MSIFPWKRKTPKSKRRVIPLQFTKAIPTQLQHAMPTYDKEPTRRGTAYIDYDEQVGALSRKALFEDEWGCSQIATILLIRSYFMLGGGVTVEPASDSVSAEREIEFANQFLKWNKIDSRVAREWGREAEIEGKFTAKLSIDDTIGPSIPSGLKIRARFFSYTANDYTVVSDPEDYLIYTGITFKNEQGQDESIDAPFFVYTRFGGRATNVNITPPFLSSILGPVEHLDRALWDLRYTNHLYGSPTPTFIFETAKAAEAFDAAIKEEDWVIGKALTLSKGTFELVTFGTGGVESIQKEIVILVKIVSGATGVPPHFLGFPDLLSNRSTADSMMETISATTGDARTIWEDFYTELIQKAITLANEHQAGLDPMAVKVKIPEMSTTAIQKVIDTLLPLHDRSIITDYDVLENIPTVDIEKVKKRKEEAASTMSLLDIAPSNEEQ